MKLTNFKVKLRESLSRIASNLYSWLFKKILAYGYKIKTYVVLSAIWRLRLHYDFPLVGEDEALDKQLSEAVESFFDRGAMVSQESEDRFLLWLSEDSVSNDDREKYLRISHWLLPGQDSSEAVEIATVYASCYGKELEPIDWASVPQTYSQLRKRSRAEYKALKKSKAQLLDIRLQDLTPLLPWFSAAFVFMGYFHTTVVFRHFGINSSYFFLPSDYLISSMEQILYVLLPFIFYFWGILGGYKNYNTKSKYERARNRRRDFLHDTLIVLVSILLLVYTWRTSQYSVATLVGVIGLIQIPVLYFCVAHFKKSFPVFLGSMVIIGSFSGVFISAKERIQEIEKESSEVPFRITAGGESYSEKNSTLVGSNSGYVFLHVHENRVEVIPIEKVNRFSFPME